jgi:uncharacterized protein YndB with AHSA1/START domain
MSVQHDSTGRRFVELSLEVPGTPEEVWHAIATGPGISSWFVPATNEEKDGVPVSQSLTFGPGMVSTGAITAWDAPRMYAKESKGWLPGSPNLATEWHVEAKSGGICVIRIVHSLFASTDDWDGQLEGAAGGWPAFLATLQLYLTHFRGQPSALLQLSAPTIGSDADVWAALTRAVGVSDVAVGQSFTAPDGVPALRGVVEYRHETPFDALLRIDTPAPGIAALGVASWPGGPTMAAMNFYLYGTGAGAVVAQLTPVWEAWLQERFPAPPATAA